MFILNGSGNLEDDVREVPGGREISKEQFTSNMDSFVDQCCRGYRCLRQNANILINLFLIMLSAGMPELKKKEEIQRLVIKLDMNASEQEADKKFKEEIDRAQATFSRRVDNLMHNWKQV